MKFRDHKYTWQRPFAAVLHQWSFRGPDGGVHFTATVMDDREKYGDTAGLEFHHNFQPYGDPEAAHHSPCWLTGQPCWHDGTSSYAMDKLWPVIRGMVPGHDAIFRLLEAEYDSHFLDLLREWG